MEGGRLKEGVSGLFMVPTRLRLGFDFVTLRSSDLRFLGILGVGFIGFLGFCSSPYRLKSEANFVTIG